MVVTPSFSDIGVTRSDLFLVSVNFNTKFRVV